MFVYKVNNLKLGNLDGMHHIFQGAKLYHFFESNKFCNMFFFFNGFLADFPLFLHFLAFVFSQIGCLKGE